ncbi:bifunctional UDP-N-acetylglucosamine diphosphorylase/glucosamine-1-phosphate N-acetyltransferase GlmU [uncultured Amnibacterium sp.]|uniref:bifunctional UDP-N-acetylglucosamine diphosphorylase/glucosamine-1-phosphate N-acetyltransferase GlmU n=1 Tax=uncultured Amnibacterium sp. TaxID=1631851 RepID=UPI0035CA19A6
MTDSQLAVVVLAAGQGTRMHSRVPKVLHPIAGLPMIAHVLGAAVALQPAHLLVVVRHERDAVAAAVQQAAPTARVVDQDEVSGTGRAVEAALAALPDFGGDVLVLNGDLPLLDSATVQALLDAHRDGRAAATVLTARFADPSGAGRIVRGADGAIVRIVEHRDATPAERAIDEVNAGVYAFRTDGLAPRLAALGTANDQGERYLTDIVAALLAEGASVAGFEAPDERTVAGVNDRVQLAEAAAHLNAAIVRRWQQAGVTVQDPATTWIDVTVTIAEDVTVLRNTHLAGATVIARDAIVGPDSTLTDCEIGEGAHIRSSEATLAVVGARAEVGPYSYLRAGTLLGADGKIGAYVETKNAQIGAGTKVPHLSYVGDTVAGERSNIGAGTITANYDGVDKHRTVIGSDVRIGSGSTLIAPVSVGDGAYTGAGAVVRKDVPPGALALTVAPQRNMAGWVESKRPDSAAARAAARAAEQQTATPRAAGQDEAATRTARDAGEGDRT